jgi:predicted nucleotidyltransferase
VKFGSYFENLFTMNIRIKNVDFYEQLKMRSLVRIEFGSQLYGTKNEKSDTDYLYIYRTSESELRSFLQSKHAFQFKEDGFDHNFVSLHAFIRNLLDGDSTIHFEVLHSEDLKNCIELKFLYDMRYDLVNYSIIKSYLGLARRDLKLRNKQKTAYDFAKAILHAYRGFFYAESLMEQNFTLKNEKYLNIYQSSVFDIELLLTQIDKLRNDLNSNNHFNRYISLENAQKLDFYLHQLMKSDMWAALNWEMNLDLFYNAFENWVEY